MELDREQLMNNFDFNYSHNFSDIVSLNLWSNNSSQESFWVAGILSVRGEDLFLIGQNNELYLENFTDLVDIIVGDKTFSVKNFMNTFLLEGDKIAVKFNKGAVNSIKILALNLTSMNESVRSSQVKWKIEEKWLSFVKEVESYFIDKKFYLAKTPNLVPCPGLEPTLNPFAVQLEFGKKKKLLFLPTSPELHLKKIIAEGVTEIFEITPCFRNGEIGFQHQPEFTMLEWYRSYRGLDSIIEDIKNLIIILVDQKDLPSFREVSVKSLFNQYLNFDLTPNTTQTELFELAKRFDLQVASDDSWNDIFFMIFIDKIESELGKDGIDFVFDYPPSQAALAKLNKEGWADRFEMYWQGYEIANAFNELTDPVVQKQRFVDEQLERKKLNKQFIPIDQEFIEALNYGLPPTAGIAMGLERLFMAVNKVSNINDLLYFPIIDN